MTSPPLRELSVMHPCAKLAWVAFVGSGLGACGYGGTDPAPPPAPTYLLGGTMAGLAGGGLVLQNNGGNDLSVGAGAGTFTFSGSQNQGASYNVSVKTQPTSPSQTCTVAGGAGTIGTANVTTVAVTCTTAPSVITLGGTVSGLTGSGLVLQNNGSSNLTIAPGASSFTFPGELAAGTAYRVTAGTQPFAPWQTCTVANGTGTANAAVSNVAIACAVNQYTVGGTITGLAGAGLTLQLNGGTPLAVAAGATSFVFGAVPSMTTYTLTVATQPTGPVQICSVVTGGGASGPGSQVTGANITTAVIDCGAVGSAVGGTVSGLTGTGLALKLNGGAALAIPARATTFSFAAGIATGEEFMVLIVGQPTGQTCTLLRAEGTKSAPIISSVGVECIANVTSPLSGTYTRPRGGFREYLTFWPDGTFTYAVRGEDNNCPDRGNSVEYGVYNYNAATKAFAFVRATTDGNGQCGYTHGNGANLTGTVTVSADTLFLHSNAAGFTHVWLAVPSTPSSIIGSFSFGRGLSDGTNGSFAVFQPDNTYLVASTQLSLGGGGRPGYERACYVASAGNITPTKSQACQPDGKPVVITNGGGLDDGVPLPFAITGPDTFTIAATFLLRRIVPN